MTRLNRRHNEIVQKSFAYAKPYLSCFVPVGGCTEVGSAFSGADAAPGKAEPTSWLKAKEDYVAFWMALRAKSQFFCRGAFLSLFLAKDRQPRYGNVRGGNFGGIS